MKWNKVEFETEEKKKATVVKFDTEGQEFMGRLLEIVEYKRDDEEKMFWKFTDLDDDEIEYIIFPSAVLKTKMANIEEGTPVKIVYLGKKKSGKSSFYFKDYDIYTGS